MLNRSIHKIIPKIRETDIGILRLSSKIPERKIAEEKALLTAILMAVLIET
jgi:hypothetical protein